MRNEFLADSNPDLRQVAGLDAAFLSGDGSTPSPPGMRNFVSVTETAAGASGAQPTIKMLLAQVGRLEASNANFERCAWFMHARNWKSIKGPIDDEGQYILNQDPSQVFARRVFGIPVYLSTQVPIAETVGGSRAACSSLILADMDHRVVGRRQEIDLQYSTDFAFHQDSTAIRATAASTCSRSTWPAWTPWKARSPAPSGTTRPAGGAASQVTTGEFHGGTS